jgi:hypothetical protein
MSDENPKNGSIFNLSNILLILFSIIFVISVFFTMSPGILFSIILFTGLTLFFTNLDKFTNFEIGKEGLKATLKMQTIEKALAELPAQIDEASKQRIVDIVNQQDKKNSENLTNYFKNIIDQQNEKNSKNLTTYFENIVQQQNERIEQIKTALDNLQENIEPNRKIIIENLRSIKPFSIEPIFIEPISIEPLTTEPLTTKNVNFNLEESTSLKNWAENLEARINEIDKI